MVAPTTREPLRTALCVGQWLPASETFIYDQLTHQNRTRGRVIARGTTRHAARFPYDDIVHLGPVERSAFYHWGIAPTVGRALRAHRTELIHAHFGPNGTMMLPFAEALGIPLVVSFHGHDVGGLEPQNRGTIRYGRYQRMAKRLFSYGDLFLCASEELCELVMRHGAPPSRTKLHHLGIDVGRFRPAPQEGNRPRSILMVGRLVEKKGMYDGLEAFRRVVTRFPETNLTIVGEGPLEGSLRRRARDLGIAQRVAWRGALSSDDVLREMQKASLLLVPSLTTASGDRESGVIVIKEAGATGLPTVATHHGGIPEIIDEGKTGFMVSERDVQGLSERLERLLSSSELRLEMGAAARRLVEKKYDSKTQNEILEEHLIRAAPR